MSVATQITRLQNAKAAIKTAIEAKGVSVISTEKLDNYATHISAIQQESIIDSGNIYVSGENKNDGEYAWVGIGAPWTTVAAKINADYSFKSATYNNKIYCIGGYVFPTGNFCYDPTTNTWSTKLSMTYPRRNLIVETVGNYIYAGGGMNPSNQRQKYNEQYNPNTNTWTTKADAPAIYDIKGSAEHNGLLYIVGGTNFCYNPNTNTWTTKTSGGIGGAEAVTYNDKIYCIGGGTGNFCYNPTTNTWETKTSMSTSRSYFGLEIINEKFYAIAGYNGASNLSTVEVYEPTTDTWTFTEDIITARRVFGCTTVENSIFCVGGYTSSATDVNEKLNIAFGHMDIEFMQGLEIIEATNLDLTVGDALGDSLPYPTNPDLPFRLKLKVSLIWNTSIK